MQKPDEHTLCTYETGSEPYEGQPSYDGVWKSKVIYQEGWEGANKLTDTYPEPENLREVIPGVLGSALPLPRHLEGLRKRGVTDIINFTDDAEYYANEAKKNNITIHHFPIHKRKDLNNPEILKKVADLIEEKKGKILVHCLKGNTRTMMGILAHHARYNSAGYANLLKTFISGRKGLKPIGNISVFRELRKYPELKKKTKEKVEGILDKNHENSQ